jgi:hypothetical protein
VCILRGLNGLLGNPIHAREPVRRALELQPEFRRWHRARAVDAVLDAAALPAVLRARRAADGRPGGRRRVLVLTVVREDNEVVWRRAEAELRGSGHDVLVELASVGDAGKFANLNRLLSGHALDECDWLLVIDDDVVLPESFLDVFLVVAEHFQFRVVQPAHRMVSHASWPVTRRRPLSIARATNFVEIGPVTALDRRCFPVLTPFPSEGMGWGLDFAWATTASERGWPIGIVDLTPIAHLTPAGGSYSMSQAAAAMHGQQREQPRTAETFRRVGPRRG